MRPWRVICAPLDSAGEDEGEARAPQALLRAGLVEAVGAQGHVTLDTAVTSARRDAGSGVIGVADVVAANRAVAAAVERALLDEARPLVVGGDCALVPGILAAATRSIQDLRLAFVDGHLDALDGTTSPTGEAADMDLSVITGRGPAVLVPAGAAQPIVAPERIVAVGFRSDVEPDIRLDGELVTEASLVHPDVRVIDAAQLDARGPEATARAVLEAGAPLWLHLDVDVLDESELPAVSYPQPNGPGVETVRSLLRALVDGAPIAGAHVTCFNADLDPSGESAARVVSLVAELCD